MTASIKTLDALKAATLRLERLETYMLQCFPQRPIPEVDWTGPNGLYEAHTDVKRAVAKLLAPQLPGLVVEVLEAARADVAGLTRDLQMELDHPLVKIDDAVVVPRHPLPPEAKSLNRRLLEAANCYPDSTEGIVALLREAAAACGPVPPTPAMHHSV